MKSNFWTFFSSVQNQSVKDLGHQGWKSSDNYLISDFFQTPRTIPEISVNLQRKFLGGVGSLLKVHLVGEMGLQIFKVLKFLVYVSHL